MLKKEKGNRSKLKIIILVVVVILVIAAVAGLLTVHFYLSKINIESDDTGVPVESLSPDTDEEDTQMGEEATQEEIDNMQDNIDSNIMEQGQESLFQDNVFHVLLIGSDTRVSGENGRSDTMILISVNRTTKEITMTSFMRDIYLQIPGHGYNRLNAAFAYGGAKLLMETIQLNFKIDVEKYVRVDFDSFVQLVDALGGVTVDVDPSEVSRVNLSVKMINGRLGLESTDGMLEEGGLVTLSGKQALGFVRNRQYANGDFSRTENQREVVSQLCSKIFHLSISEANDLLNTFLPQISTNLSEGEILTQLISLPGYVNYPINQICVPSSDSFSYVKIRGMSVLKIDFTENINSIFQEIYGEQADD